MKFDRALLLVVYITSLVSLVGCSEPTMSPVTGTVFFEGQPVNDATVTFIAADGRPATGDTNDKGHFSLSTFEAGDGAWIGEHIVTITKWIPVEGDEAKEALNLRRLPSTLNPGRIVTLGNFLPLHYSDLQKSGLTATVEAWGENDFTFDLEK